MAKHLTLNKRRRVRLVARECLLRRSAVPRLVASSLQRQSQHVAGDTLVVCKLDRLARSTRDLLNTLDAIASAGASFKSLCDGWADTTTPHGRLMLTVLGGLAEFERHLILARASEGAPGHKLGVLGSVGSRS